MSDDLDDLGAAMRAATPEPDAATKAAHLALARKNFEALQGSRPAARPMSDGSKASLWTGVKIMLNTLTSRAGLTATTAIVAVAFVALSPMRDSLAPGDVPRFDPSPAIASQDAQEAASDSVQIVQEPPAGIAEEFMAEATSPVRRMSKSLAAPAGSAEMGQAIALMPPPDLISPPDATTEAFANADSNPLRITAEHPVSTFSIDVDTASYSVVRNSLMQGRLPLADMVRIEELVNYFPYNYPAPVGEAPFQPTVSVGATPWNPDTRLVHIGIQGALPDIAERPPLNLVFLIDTSGSMNQPNKLPLLKQSFALMLGQLQAQDQVAIVTYAGSAGQVLEPTPASERQTIMAALNRLDAGGSTAGQAGLQQAYAAAAAMAQEGEVSRVILATDGDFNVGLSDPSALQDFIADKRQGGTYLSVLGFGRGNLDDATMQALAQNGNGQAAYIDTLAEAQKVLVDQLTGALFPIADDVKIQVEFNPATVAEYRLIGYETRALRREDFNNDKVDAGDIGAGHAVTALYEITPVGSPARLSEPLRYGATETGSTSDELGFLWLRYKAPGSGASQLIETAITADMAAQPDTAFATAIAGFGQLLRGGRYLGSWGYDEAIELASSGKGADPYGYRSEAVQLMRLAQSLAAQ
ncbi:vWA domain-containing protein [Microbulbifer sp. S227A]|uniref:vWA domain-containing protein n=1 Tax=Microbulbifer sp. S227A TaxID=3415131 RepID=UPI003C7BCA6C